MKVDINSEDIRKALAKLIYKGQYFSDKYTFYTFKYITTNNHKLYI